MRLWCTSQKGNVTLNAQVYDPRPHFLETPPERGQWFSLVLQSFVTESYLWTGAPSFCPVCADRVMCAHALAQASSGGGGGGRPPQRVEEQGTRASRTRKRSEADYGRPEDGGVWAAKPVKRTPQQPAQPPMRQLLGATDAQTAHPATSSTAPTHQLLGSANAETTPAGAPATAADRTQRPDMRREERVTVQGPVKKQQPDGMSHRGVVQNPFPRPGFQSGPGALLRCSAILTRLFCNAQHRRPSCCVIQKSGLFGATPLTYAPDGESPARRYVALPCDAETPFSGPQGVGLVEAV